MLGLDGIHRASSSRIGPRASVRSSRLTTIGLSRRFLAGSNAAADNYRIGNARSSFHGGLSRTRVRLPPPPPHLSPLRLQLFQHSRAETIRTLLEPEVRGSATYIARMATSWGGRRSYESLPIPLEVWEAHCSLRGRMRLSSRSVGGKTSQPRTGGV
jgi:hypothetical protein